MNWTKLRDNPDWQEFWTGPWVREREAALERQLTGSAMTDPHTLGRLRGQLGLLREMRELASVQSNLELEDHREKAKAVAEGTRKPLSLVEQYYAKLQQHLPRAN